MAEKLFELTVNRHGDEPRIKQYRYPKAADDGFDTAVVRKGRLASSIVLEEIKEIGTSAYDGEQYLGETITYERQEIRRWDRPDLHEGPTVLYLLEDANDEAVSYVADANGIDREDIYLVSFPRAWDYISIDEDEANDKKVYYSTAERLAAIIKDLPVLADHAFHAFWMPEHNAHLMVHLAAAYHRRFGRFPYIVDEQWTNEGRDHKLVDLNKVSF